VREPTQKKRKFENGLKNPLDNCGKPDCSDESQNIRGPTRIIAKYVEDHAVNVTDTAGFGVTRAVRQDMCHGKTGRQALAHLVTSVPVSGGCDRSGGASGLLRPSERI
jgi:hypothetical protein